MAMDEEINPKNYIFQQLMIIYFNKTFLQEDNLRILT